MTRPLKIVQVAPNYYPIPPENYGGIERVVHSLTENLVKKGHEVYLYAKKGSKSSAHLIPYEYEGFDQHVLAKFVKETLPADVDIIHDHTQLSAVGKIGLSTPTICTVHCIVNNDIPYPIYVSKNALQGVGNNEGAYVYNGIDIDDFPLTKQKDDYLLYLGSLHEYKGVHHAIDIAEATHNKLIIAGPALDWEYFTKKIQPRLEKNKDIQYIGEIGGSTKMDILKKAKCMLFPTLCDEPFGLVMIEAMACGTPVVALANGAVSEVMCDFSQLICQSVQEMLECVAQNNYPSPHVLREYVAKYFSADRMTDCYVEEYRKVIASDKHTVTEEKIARGEISAMELYEYGNRLKEEHQYERSVEIYERFFDMEEKAVEKKLCACEQVIEIYEQLGDVEKQKEYIYKTFEFAEPRTEFCCRLGYQFLQEGRPLQAAFWYRLATTLKPPKKKTGVYYKACWTWLPHLQLAICYHQLGQYEQAYAHNEKAGEYDPNNPAIINNRTYFQTLLKRE